MVSDGVSMHRGKVVNREEEEISENHCWGVLTGIQYAYTLSATDDANEVDRLMIKEFLHTLAEISLAVASRKMETNPHESRSLY